ncbi:hypothetical protein ABPG75_005311 [Micractinium tetrahymenae]
MPPPAGRVAALGRHPTVEPASSVACSRAMGRFELTGDSGALLLSGLATAAFGASMLLAPRKAHAHFYGEGVSTLISAGWWRGKDAGHLPAMRCADDANTAAAAYTLAAAVGRVPLGRPRRQRCRWPARSGWPAPQ